MKKIKSQKKARVKQTQKKQKSYKPSFTFLVILVLTLFVSFPLDMHYLFGTSAQQTDVLGAKIVCTYKTSKNSKGCLVTVKTCGSNHTTSISCSKAKPSPYPHPKPSVKPSAIPSPTCQGFKGVCTSNSICHAEHGHIISGRLCSSSTICCKF